MDDNVIDLECELLARELRRLIDEIYAADPELRLADGRLVRRRRRNGRA